MEVGSQQEEKSHPEVCILVDRGHHPEETDNCTSNNNNKITWLTFMAVVSIIAFLRIVVKV